MSDGSLSQDEIDALLQGSGGEPAQDLPPLENASGGLSEADRNTFLSVVQGTAGSQAGNLTSLVTKTAKLEPLKAAVMTRDALTASLGSEAVQVFQNFSEGLLGDHSYILPKELALSVSGLMMGQAEVELNEAALSALGEAVSQMSGPVLTALGDTLKTTVLADPSEAKLAAQADISLPEGEFLVLTYPLTIEGNEPASFWEIFTLQQAAEVAAKKSGPPPQKPQAAGPAVQQAPMMGAAPAGAYGGGMQNPMMGGGMPPGYGMAMPQMNPGMMMGGAPSVQAVQFPSLNSGVPPMEHGNISLLMDVSMEMTVELGRTKKPIKEILSMGEGTIIELDKLAGEPVDILVNHKLIAKGEVVVIDENFGVRVTEIVAPGERMSDLT
ncbi:MAG: flagellar motor switch protein FliN [Spirochaetales bacterium]|jgi:flagellar motor switch protein FliN/FliY|nr:flagellar motor switch protein FliN [Spirochaetales bacterium]